MKALFTIGVYQKTEEEFYSQLISNKIELFCDVRNRRGMRGSLYRFVNSKYLQQKLSDLNIRYYHLKELAPNKEIREQQKTVDKINDIKKRERAILNEEFVKLYEQQVLLNFDFNYFMNDLLLGEQNIVLFCVENYYAACHRSLIAEKIIKLFPEIEIIHL